MRLLADPARAAVARVGSSPDRMHGAADARRETNVIRILAVNAGLQPPLWHDLFGTFATVCAALLGLFYVAISLHVGELENHPIELNRAQAGLHGLLVGLLMSLLTLIPQQPLAWLGIELIAVEVGWLVIAIPAGRRNLRRVRWSAMIWLDGIVSFIAVGLVIVAGISLIAGQGPGLFLVIPALLTILLISSYFAWSVLFTRSKRPTK